MIGHLNRMLYGVPPGESRSASGTGWPLIPLGACVLGLVVLGLTLPAPVEGCCRGSSR